MKLDAETTTVTVEHDVIRVKFVHGAEGTSQLFSCTKCNVNFTSHAGICFHISENHPNVDPMVPMCMKGKVLTKAERKQFDIKKQKDETCEVENNEAPCEVIGVVEVVEMVEIEQEQQNEISRQDHEDLSRQERDKNEVQSMDAPEADLDEISGEISGKDRESDTASKDKCEEKEEEKSQTEEEGSGKDQSSECDVGNQTEVVENINDEMKSKDEKDSSQQENDQSKKLGDNDEVNADVIKNAKAHKKRRKPQRVTMKIRKRTPRKTPSKANKTTQDAQKGEGKTTKGDSSKKVPVLFTKVREKKSVGLDLNANDSVKHAEIKEDRKETHEAEEENRDDGNLPEVFKTDQEGGSFFISCSEAAKLRRNSKDSDGRNSPEDDWEVEGKKSGDLCAAVSRRPSADKETEKKD